MARLVPTDINDKNLAQAKGWLAEDDPFFKTIESIVQSRSKHTANVRHFSKIKRLKVENWIVPS
ncbi:MAG: hypothetical protein ACNYWU_03375 [Desulfobacterales bacterium]